MCGRRRHNVGVHLANEIVDESSVCRSENEIRGLRIVGAAEVVGLRASQCGKNFAEGVNQVVVPLTISVHDDPKLLKCGCV